MTDTAIYMSDVQPRSRFFSNWERRRHSRQLHWFVECFAEFLGVFFYVYAGVGSEVPFVLGPILGEPGLGSLQQVGWGYCAGIVFAVSICSSTSGGHFNPCISIAQVLFRGFPPLKALRYIVAQILGAYIACLLVYVQYREFIQLAELALTKSPALQATMFTPTGPAGIFALYAQNGISLGRIFLNEFVTDVFLALVIFGCIDPTNVLVPPAAAPFVIGFAYAAAIWGFAFQGLAANAARDVGGRLAAVSIWGTKASGTPGYAAIAALTNIPATLLAFLIYEIFLTDSDRVIPSAQRDYLFVHRNHRRTLDSDNSVHTTPEKAQSNHHLDKLDA